MKYIVINNSQVDDVVVDTAIAAVQKQVQIDVSPWWNVWVELQRGTVGQDADGIVTLTNSPLPGGDLGVHAYPCDKPTATVSTQAGSSWTKTLSHEVLEMLVNPRTDRLVRIPHPSAPGFNALIVEEICDPVNDRGYEIGGVEVSDFVLPAWFTSWEENLFTTHLESVGTGARIDSLQLTAGGFMLLENMAGQLTVYPHEEEDLRKWVSIHARSRGIVAGLSLP